jgi:hypothetical protein
MAVLTTILLALHLVAVNLASAGPLVCVWLHTRGRRGDVPADQTGRRLANLSLASLIVGACLGGLLVGLAWWEQHTGYWEAASRFPPRAYEFAAVEFMFSLVCLWIYARTWDRWRSRPWLHGLLAVMSATNLLYHFPPLMIVLGELSAHPHIAADTIITHEVFRHLMLRPDVLSHVAHFTVASVAVAGWTLMGLAYKSREPRVKGQQPESVGTDFDGLISAGAWIALVASLAQLAVGLWVLIEMPITTRNLLLGSNWLGTGLFFVAIVATFGLLHMLATVALGDTSDAAVRRSILLLLVIVLLMVGVLIRVRRPDEANIGIDVLVSSAVSVATDSDNDSNEAFTAWTVRPHRHFQPTRADRS